MSQELRVLIIEDDPDVRLGCEQAMMLADLPVEGVGSAEEGLARLKAGFPGIVVTDMRLPRADGMEVLRRCQAMDADLPVIIITGHGDVTLAVEAMRSGAYDFIQKPFAPDLLVDVVRRALDKRALTLEVLDLRRRLAQRDGIESKLIGRSPQMARVRQLVSDVAATRWTCWCAARPAPARSSSPSACTSSRPARTAPSWPSTAAACPTTCSTANSSATRPAPSPAPRSAASARSNTPTRAPFLDELESMPMGVQIKLLRVLQERVVERLGSNQQLPVDCRVVAATKDDLKERAERQTFRADLYYRLNVVTIDLPPLRERREDIPLLLEHFLLLAAARHDRPLPAVPPEQMRRLMAHTWPGNVRELRNVADCIVLGVSTEVLGGNPADTPPASLAESVDSFERSLIAAELRRQGGSLARSAEALRVAKTTLHDKIRKYGLGSGS
jgi:two-component system C4-dicarboxylate transport response regulator DctD